jgi:hypothetical protein
MRLRSAPLDDVNQERRFVLVQGQRLTHADVEGLFTTMYSTHRRTGLEARGGGSVGSGGFRPHHRAYGLVAEGKRYRLAGRGRNLSRCFSIRSPRQPSPRCPSAAIDPVTAACPSSAASSPASVSAMVQHPAEFAKSRIGYVFHSAERRFQL